MALSASVTSGKVVEPLPNASILGNPQMPVGFKYSVAYSYLNVLHKSTTKVIEKF
jgi:hypothetical protein